jgi:hypothetical protein
LLLQQFQKDMRDCSYHQFVEHYNSKSFPLGGEPLNECDHHSYA